MLGTVMAAQEQSRSTEIPQMLRLLSSPRSRQCSLAKQCGCTRGNNHARPRSVANERQNRCCSIALESGAPVIPVAHWGVQKLGSIQVELNLIPRKTIHVEAGPPVDLDDLRELPITEDVPAGRNQPHPGTITNMEAELRGEDPPKGLEHEGQEACSDQESALALLFDRIHEDEVRRARHRRTGVDPSS